MCIQDISVAGTSTFYVVPHVGVHLCHRVSMFCSVFVFYVGCVELMFFLQNTHSYGNF
jgi:hypothetical protein